MNESCPFCKPKGSDIVLHNSHCYARYDGFPVSPGHLLIVPFRHEASFFALRPEEREAGMELLDRGKELLEEERRPDGFNVGINIGQAAGQTVGMPMYISFRVTREILPIRGAAFVE